jgi:single-stranded-DNA-specific exonuclease
MLLRETGGAVPDLRRYLDLVALGTVPSRSLLEENRVLVKYGLREIIQKPTAGTAGAPRGERRRGGDDRQPRLPPRPRLNASGRLADATRAVELLTSRDLTVARPLASEIDAQNRERRGIEERSSRKPSG